MKIRLHRDEFLRQLNFDRGGDLPEFIYFDGIICDPELDKENSKELFEKHPDVANLLTQMEYRIVNKLYENLDKPVQREELYKFLNPGRNLANNTIAVYFMNLRKKIGKDKNLSLYFDTMRVSFRRGEPILRRQ